MWLRGGRCASSSIHPGFTGATRRRRRLGPGLARRKRHFEGGRQLLAPPSLQVKSSRVKPTSPPAQNPAPPVGLAQPSSIVPSHPHLQARPPHDRHFPSA